MMKPLNAFVVVFIFNKVFDQLGDLVEFSGHYLEHHLEPGKYNFSFTLFHYKDANVHSMANLRL